MTAVMVEIGRHLAAADGPETIEFVTDMDSYLESVVVWHTTQR